MPFPSPGDLPNPGIEPVSLSSPAMQAASLPLAPPGKPQHIHTTNIKWGFPGGLHSKEFACNAGDPGSIPGSGRSPGEGNGNPLQHSCLENPMDGEAW